METTKVHIEELLRKIAAEKNKGPELDVDKIIQRANQEIEKRELRRRNVCCIAIASILMAIVWIFRIRKGPE